MIEQITPPLPGAVGVTHLKVYDTRAPDGLVGGSPHLHFACTEAYLVLAGHGAVQTLGAGGFKELPLDAGGLVWFTPGLIHRLINLDSQLEILVVMQNRSEEHTSELQSRLHLVCRLLLEKKK